MPCASHQMATRRSWPGFSATRSGASRSRKPRALLGLLAEPLAVAGFLRQCPALEFFENLVRKMTARALGEDLSNRHDLRPVFFDRRLITFSLTALDEPSMVLREAEHPLELRPSLLREIQAVIRPPILRLRGY